MAGLQAPLEKRLLCGGARQSLSSLPGKAVPGGSCRHRSDSRSSGTCPGEGHGGERSVDRPSAGRHPPGRGAWMSSMQISTYGYPASAPVREMPGPGLLRGLSPCNDCGRPGRTVPIPPRSGVKGATPTRKTPFLLLRASRMPDLFRKILTGVMTTLDPI